MSGTNSSKNKWEILLKTDDNDDDDDPADDNDYSDKHIPGHGVETVHVLLEVSDPSQ